MATGCPEAAPVEGSLSKPISGFWSGGGRIGASLSNHEVYEAALVFSAHPTHRRSGHLIDSSSSFPGSGRAEVRTPAVSSRILEATAMSIVVQLGWG